MGIYMKYLKKYWLLIVTALCCVASEAVCDLLQPTLMSRIIDDGIKNNSVSIVLRYGGTMLAISLAGMFFAAMRNILASRVSQSFGADLRLDTFKKVLRFSQASADQLDSGAIITRLTNDTSQIMQFANGMMRIFFKAPLTCLGAIVLAFILSPQLSIIMFIGIAMVSVFIVISMKLSYKRFSKVQYAIDKVNTTVQEYLSGIRLVKAFDRTAYEGQKFEEVNAGLSDKSVKSQLVIVYFSPLMSLTINICIVAIFYVGSLMFGSGDVEVGRIAAFISYMTQILSSLIMIINIFNTFVRTTASAERVNEIFNSREETDESFVDGVTTYNYNFTGNSSQPSLLRFDNVTFAYPSGSGIPAVKNLSFEIGKDETLAIIGPTGSGKSTVAWLALRFYEADQGTIYYNGCPINQMDIHKYRELVAVAPQKSMLFSGSVQENILWGRSNADMAAVQAAAEIACADAFINNMPEQYNSLLGQRGVNISGGQKQRLSIARAVIKKAPILVLDDCTSALDTITEAKVRQTLRQEPSTVIMITQRIGTAMAADKILVLENGKKVGFGNHNDLLELCSVYRDIYHSQIGEV